MRRTYNFWAAVLMFFSSLLCDYNDSLAQTQKEKEQIETISQVIKTFSELKSNNKLPIIKRNDVGGKLEAYQIKEDMRREPWMDQAMLVDMKKCKDLYLVNVELKEKK